jgi:hypothetical protein
LKQQQQHINNLEEVKVSLKAWNTRILGKFYEYKFSINVLVSILVSLTCLKIIIAKESKISRENMVNLRRAFAAEGRIKDLNSQIRSLKYQLNKQ